MKVIGHHRNRKLAERHARDAGMVIVDRRNARGHKSKRGHIFIFADRLMWRYTVAGLIPRRNAKRGEDASPKMSIRATTWAKTKATLKVEEARAAMMNAIPRRKHYPFSERWFLVNEEYEQVEYDATLIGKVDVGT